MKKVTEEIKNEIIILYNNGLGTWRIAKKYNLGATTVRYYLLKQGVKFRPLKRIDKRLAKEFLFIYNQGFSIKQISERFNVAFSTVQNNLRKLNIKLRPRGNEKEILATAYVLTREKSYILGVVGPGDGFIEIPKNYPKKGTMRICLEVIDKDFTDYFALCLEKVYGLKSRLKMLKPRRTNQSWTYKVSLNSVRACDDLLKYRVSFREKDWRVPQVIKNVSDEIKSKYLQGFADSQGSVSKYKAILLASKNIEGLEELKQLFNSIQIKTWDWANGLGITNKLFLNLFNQKIGFIIQRKQESLRNVLNSYVRK